MSQSGDSGVLRAAGAMGAATFISRILGLVREQVFAFMFGAGHAMDAFNVAFRIPNLLRDLFAEGSMSAALVPIFTRVRKEEGDRRAWRVVGLVFRVLFIVVTLLSVVGIFFAPQLVELYSSAFHGVAGKFELTTRMTRIMFPFFPLVVLAAAFMGILNACGYFFLLAFSSALFNLVSITVGTAMAFLFTRNAEEWGVHPIEGMAIGVVAGGLIQAFSQLPALRRCGYRFQPREQQDPVWNQDPALKQMLFMMIPGSVGMAATQVNILVNTVLATSQGEGAVSWLNYAFRLMQFPIGIFGVSLAAATLPRISKLWVERDLPAIEQTLHRSLRQVLAINLPAAAGLAFLGYPIIQLIFQYGRFKPEDTQATAFALAMYALGLAAYSAVKVLVPACYALGNTRIAVISSVLTVGATIALNLVMIGPFGYWGLALGTSIGATINAAFLLFAVRGLIRKGGGSFHLAPLAKAGAVHLGIALLMGVTCWGTYRGLQSTIESLSQNLPKGLVRAVFVGFLILEGALVTAGLARLFKVQETTEVLDLFTNKLKKKLSRKPT